MIPLSYFIFVSFLLFSLGIIMFFLKKDLIAILMAIEIMLNASNLCLLSFSRYNSIPRGQVIALFIITIAAAEAVIGLAIILNLSRVKKGIRADEDVNLLKG
ncbi:MAG: NADH-quinone oxidoreductase subunit NuoK [Acidobacteriota bacterium]